MAGRSNGHLNPALPDTGQRDLGDWRLSARMHNLYDEQYCETDATCVSGNGFSPTSEGNLWIGVSYQLEE